MDVVEKWEQEVERVRAARLRARYGRNDESKERGREEAMDEVELRRVRVGDLSTKITFVLIRLYRT